MRPAPSPSPRGEAGEAAAAAEIVALMGEADAEAAARCIQIAGRWIALLTGLTRLTAHGTVALSASRGDLDPAIQIATPSRSGDRFGGGPPKHKPDVGPLTIHLLFCRRENLTRTYNLFDHR